MWKIETRETNWYSLLLQLAQSAAKATLCQANSLPRESLTWDHMGLYGCSASGAGRGGNVASGAGSVTLMVLDCCVTFAFIWRNLHGDPTIANVGSNTCLSGKCCRPVYGSPKSHESWRYVLLRIRHSRTSGCVAGCNASCWRDWCVIRSSLGSRFLCIKSFALVAF